MRFAKAYQKHMKGEIDDVALLNVAISEVTGIDHKLCCNCDTPVGFFGEAMTVVYTSLTGEPPKRQFCEVSFCNKKCYDQHEQA